MTAPNHGTWGWKWLALGLVVCVVLVGGWMVIFDRRADIAKEAQERQREEEERLMRFREVEARAGARRVTAGPEELLRMVEDEALSLNARGLAARELAKFDHQETVGRLVKLLPGGYDVLTLDIIDTLGRIGDPRALPTLERMVSEGGQVRPGKINAALDWAIRRCRGK